MSSRDGAEDGRDGELMKGVWTAGAEITRRFLAMAKFRTRRTETHHLTRRGWVRFEGPPADRVETWEVEIYKPSRFYLVQTRTWRCVWASPDASRRERDALRAKYPMDDWYPYHQAYDVRVGEPL